MLKETERSGSYRRTVAAVIAIAVIILSYLVIRPFIVPILSAAALAFIFYPFYLSLLRFFRSKEVSAMVTLIIIILIVLVPVMFITAVLTGEIKDGYQLIQDFLQTQQFSFSNLPPALSGLSNYLPQLKALAADLAGQMIGILQNVVKSVPNVLLNILITIFSTYYFLKHGKELYLYFAALIPLPDGKHTQILQRLDDLSRGMIMGQLVVGVVQGILIWAGLVFLGVPNPVLFGFMTAIISAVPLLGAAMVWFPIAVYLLFAGMMVGVYWKAIALFLYGFLVISTIDNFLKPKIMGQHANVHPLIILFGILGGIQLFGIPGMLIGPLILTVFDVVIEIYKETL